MSTPTVAPGEQTPLLAGVSSKHELIDQSEPRAYKKQNKFFNIAVIAAITMLLGFAAATTVYFFLLKDKVVDNNENNSLKSQFNNILASEGGLPFLTLLQTAVDDGKIKLRDKQVLDNEHLDDYSPSYKHQHSIVQTETGDKQADYGFVENEATKFLKDHGVRGVVDYNATDHLRWTTESGCYRLQEKVLCNASRYRHEDGFCNNVHNPRWGAAMRPFRRVLPANYSDGVSAPRGGFNTTLPTARDVSVFVHRSVYRQDSKFSVMLAVWGQFIDHDITATALSRGPNGGTIKCCQPGRTDPACFPVLLSDKDEYYRKFNTTCMEFVRSAAALRCSFGPREQLNQVSSFLDGSMIYGSTENLNTQLRAYKDGLLDMSYTKDGRALLPYSRNPNDGCNQKEQLKKGKYCFLSGDSRANENTYLTSIHLILARQHNNMAKKLKKVNPGWDDEKLYQEARHIVAAQVQFITYNEFLPHILGENVMNELKLYPEKEGYMTSYDANLDPTVSNNFASSAFRFAHTLIPKLMKKLTSDNNSREYIEMHKMLLNPFDLYKGDLDSIVRGAMNTAIEKADTYFTEELTKHLFEFNETERRENGKNNFTHHTPGLDLVTLNIQRGRDHGLPSYIHWREYCNSSKISSFDALSSTFDEDALNTISEIYKSVDDIDLYTGGLAEKPIADGLIGHTLTRLISDQFYRLKYGDRYWFETNERPQAFTADQLKEIRKTSLAGIICENSDNITSITPEVMRKANDNNHRVLCSNIPQLDPSHWRDNTDDTKDFRQMANENPWSWKKHAKAGFWNEYLLENDTFSPDPVLPEWASIWATNHSSRISSVVVNELKNSMQQLSNVSDFSKENLEHCNITIKSMDIELVVKNNEVIKPPREIPVRSLPTKLLIWNPNASDLFSTEFKIIGKDDITSLGPLTAPNVSCFKLLPKCRYYSKIILGDVSDDENLFEVTDTQMTDLCSFAAPILLEGHYVSNDIFYWNGYITIYLETLSSLNKEEMSWPVQRRSLTLPKVEGSVSIRERGLWNGTFPVIFNTSVLSWYSTEDTIVYPVSWSGFYDEFRFEGVFLLPEKFNGSSIRWHDGSFSIQLPAIMPHLFRDLIPTNGVYSSVVYLTSSPKDIDRINVSAFNEITDWIFVDYFQVILVGKFEKYGKFVWNGECLVNIG